MWMSQRTRGFGKERGGQLPCHRIEEQRLPAPLRCRGSLEWIYAFRSIFRWVRDPRNPMAGPRYSAPRHRSTRQGSALHSSHSERCCDRSSLILTSSLSMSLRVTSPYVSTAPGGTPFIFERIRFFTSSGFSIPRSLASAFATWLE